MTFTIIPLATASSRYWVHVTRMFHSLTRILSICIRNFLLYIRPILSSAFITTRLGRCSQTYSCCEKILNALGLHHTSHLFAVEYSAIILPFNKVLWLDTGIFSIVLAHYDILLTIRN